MEIIKRLRFALFVLWVALGGYVLYATASHAGLVLAVTAAAALGPYVRPWPLGAALTQAQLAEAVGRDKTRLITTLDGLEARGLLRRTPDPADRRNKIVALTQEGRELRAAVSTDIRRAEQALLQPLTPADRTTFRRLLRLLDAHP